MSYSVMTEHYPKIMAIVAAENIALDEAGFKDLVGARIPFRESSLNVLLVGDDSSSFGAYQNKITVELRRDYPLGWTEIDSIAMVLLLVMDPWESQRRWQQTFLEHLRHWRNRGWTGNRLLYIAIRSTNRGFDYNKAMDDKGDAYVRAVVVGYPDYN